MWTSTSTWCLFGGVSSMGTELGIICCLLNVTVVQRDIIKNALSLQGSSPSSPSLSLDSSSSSSSSSANQAKNIIFFSWIFLYMYTIISRENVNNIQVFTLWWWSLAKHCCWLTSFMTSLRFYWWWLAPAHFPLAAMQVAAML